MVPEKPSPAPNGKPHTTPRHRTPTVLQMEGAECGAAALAIVLAYYGRHVPLAELREACGVSRDGSKARHLVSAARRYGLKARGYRAEPESLPGLPLPLIAWWNFNHFVVVEGFARDRVQINDPATGPRTVTHTEFSQSFTGVVLLCEPGPDFTRGGEQRSMVDALRTRLKGSEIAVTYAVIAGLALVLPGLVVPTFLRVFIDQVLVLGTKDLVSALLIGMAITAAIRALLAWLQDYYLLRLETRLALSTSSKFFWHVLRLPVSFFDQRYGGEIASRVAINDEVAALLSGDLAKTLIDLVVVVFTVVLMVQYDITLTLIGIGIAALNLAALRYVSRRRVDGSQKLLQERGKLTGTAINGLQMIETLKASASESDFFARWAGYLAKVMNAQQDLGVPSAFLSSIPPLLSSLNITAILLVGSVKVINGGMTVGMLVAFQNLMFMFIGPFNQIVNLGGTLQEVEGGMSRLDDVLGHPLDGQLLEAPPPPAEETQAAGERVRLTGQVELRHVTFGYNPLEPALIEDLNLVLKPGSRVALVGGSGSGKSTISKLVCGLYEPWEGDILFDGLPRGQVPRAVLNTSLALVDQEIHLFEGTIRENLSLWDATVPEAQMVQAAKDACIHEDISSRSAGYDYLLIEGGRNFSGGQRQRLEIARALVGNPTLLVLDEATSALDPATESQIDDSLRRRGCTCLIVAHRLSTIRDCDEIVVLENGKVVQRGTHDELYKIEGPYSRLIKAEAPISKSKYQSVLESLYAK